VVVVGHHPLLSGGKHGGHFSWKEHVFPLREIEPWLYIPLPILGSAYPLLRKSGSFLQDMSSGPYTALREALDEVFDRDEPLIYASGHEHNLQLLKGRTGPYQIVSGAGYFDTTSPVVDLDETLYARNNPGFVRLEFGPDPVVPLTVIEIDLIEGRPVEAFRTLLGVTP
jgi:hypothetical protein